MGNNKWIILSFALLAAVVSSADPIRLPLYERRKQVPINNSVMLINREYVEYYTKMLAGSDGQLLEVVFDTTIDVRRKQ